MLFNLCLQQVLLPTLKITSSHIMSKSLCQLGFRVCANFCTAATSLARQGDAPMISPGSILTHHICFPAPPAYPSTHFTLRFSLYACWCCSFAGTPRLGMPLATGAGGASSPTTTLLNRSCRTTPLPALPLQVGSGKP